MVESGLGKKKIDKSFKLDQKKVLFENSYITC